MKRKSSKVYIPVDSKNKIDGNLDLTRMNQMLRQMVEIRAFSNKIKEMVNKKEIGNYVFLPDGHEAAAVGVCSGLRQEDLMVTYHRNYDWYLAKGGSMPKLFAEFFGSPEGCSKGGGGCIYEHDDDVGLIACTDMLGGSVSYATGIAQAIKLNKEDRVAVGVCGDATTVEGVFHESMNVAALRRLPVIYVVVNNRYAIHAPLREYRVGEHFGIHAQAFKIANVELDGNDVSLVRAVTETVREYALSGKPVLIQLNTYRLYGHSGIGDDVDNGIRPREEVEAAKLDEPLARYASMITEDMWREAEEKVEKAYKMAKMSEETQLE
jgi:TPP-dependent pyruvate/acetoin dehydrogenase alpha subunit